MRLQTQSCETVYAGHSSARAGVRLWLYGIEHTVCRRVKRVCVRGVCLTPFPFVCWLACVPQGQTPFDVADESVEALLEELSQTQANVSRFLSKTHTHTSTLSQTFALSFILPLPLSVFSCLCHFITSF